MKQLQYLLVFELCACGAPPSTISEQSSEQPQATPAISGPIDYLDGKRVAALPLNHAIVGEWQGTVDGVDTTYTFDKDGDVTIVSVTTSESGRRKTTTQDVSYDLNDRARSLIVAGPSDVTRSSYCISDEGQLYINAGHNLLVRTDGAGFGGHWESMAGEKQLQLVSDTAGRGSVLFLTWLSFDGKAIASRFEAQPDKHVALWLTPSSTSSGENFGLTLVDIADGCLASPSATGFERK